MGKSGQRGPGKGQAPTRTGSGHAASVTRRSVIARFGYGAAGFAVLGGAGVWGVRHVRAIEAEHDLSRLGRGVPAVVQVHDPQCPVCLALQRQTRKALRDFGEDEIIYLVANIRTPGGSGFAARHGVPHVTLLLFDGQGNLRDTLQGPREADALRPAFGRLVRHG